MRGRDAIAVALRHPDGRIVWATERLDSRVPRHALVEAAARPRPGRPVRDADRRARAGSSAARTSRPRRRASSSARAPVALMLGITLVVGDRLLLPAAAVHRERHDGGSIENGLAQHCVEGLIRVALFLGYLVAHRAGAGHPPRLPVPRRRAHDDPRARGRRPADRRGGPQVPDRPPALRHGVPGRRDRSSRSSRSRWSAGRSRWS